MLVSSIAPLALRALFLSSLPRGNSYWFRFERTNSWLWNFGIRLFVIRYFGVFQCVQCYFLLANWKFLGVRWSWPKNKSGFGAVCSLPGQRWLCPMPYQSWTGRGNHSTTLRIRPFGMRHSAGKTVFTT